MRPKLRGKKPGKIGRLVCVGETLPEEKKI